MANPSVRGPFLPAWQDQSSADFRQWWIYPFQDKLLRSADVRAAGCTASMSIAPHIQSYVWLTDRIGWELVGSERSVTGCYQLVWPETVFKSEIGASRLFIRHNYNLAVLMRALSDADFRRPQDFNDGFQHDPSMLGVPDYHHRLPMPPLAKDRRRMQLEPLEVVNTNSDNKGSDTIRFDSIAQPSLQPGRCTRPRLWRTTTAMPIALCLSSSTCVCLCVCARCS